MPASRILRLARTSRWAIVTSGTRKARAISSVCRPPSVRSVSATLPFRRERRVAAGEDEPESVIGDHAMRLDLVGGRSPLDEPRLGVGLGLQDGLLLGQDPCPPESVDGAAPGGGRDPGAGVVGDAIARPVLERRHERVLDRVLGQVEVAEDADQAGERAAGFPSEGLLGGRSSIAHAPPAGHARSGLSSQRRRPRQRP